jgi:hypothetical protein
MRVGPPSHRRRVAPEDPAPVLSRQPTTRSIALRRASALALGAAAIFGAGLFSLQTVAGNEALDFWLQEWSRGRPQERARPAPADPQLKITVRPRRERGGEGSRQHEASRSEGGAYCVRTCDGFYFPLSPQKRSDSEARALCQSLCPSAATEVYERRGGPEASFAQAVSRSGKPYSKLSTAFAFQKKAVAACTCRSSGTPALTVAQDPTLQPGDIVVTDKGVRVFHGGKKLPYEDQAFVDYRKDKEVSKTNRAFLDFVDRRYRAAQAESAAKHAEAAPAKKTSRKSGKNAEQARSPASGSRHGNDALSAYAQGQENSP